MRSRSAWSVVILFALSLVLAACSGEGSSDDTSVDEPQVGDTTTTAVGDTATTADGDDIVEITLWFGRDGFHPAGDPSPTNWDPFYEMYPNIRVIAETVPMEEAPLEFIRSVGTDFEPDAFQIFEDQIGVPGSRDILRDMSDMWERWEDEDPDGFHAMYPVAFEGASFGGTTYGVSPFQFPQWLSYRVDWYEDEGLQHPPQTWDEVLEASRRFVATDPSRIGFSTLGCRANDPVTWFTSPGYAMGMEDRDGIPVLTSDGGIYLIEFFQTLVAEGLTAEDVLAWCSDEMRAAFYQGRAGHIMASKPQQNAQREALGPDSYGQLFLVSQPPLQRSLGEPVDGRHVGRTGPMLVSANTDHPYETSLALRYLSSVENSLALAINLGSETTNGVAMQTDVVAEANPWVLDLAPFDDEVAPLPANPEQGQVSEIMVDLLQFVLQNPEDDPQQIAETFQAQLDALDQ